MEEILEFLSDNPGTISGMVSDFINKYKKIGASVANDLLDVWEDVVSDDRHYNLEATGKWKQYQAYVEAGFDESQAFALLLNNNAEVVKQVKGFSNSVDKAVSKRVKKG